MRIGLLVPSVNTTLEPEFYRLLPQGISLHFARLKLERDAPEEFEEMSADLEDQAKRLAHARVNVIGFGCTTGSLFRGVGYDQEIIKRIEDATGIAATTTSTAVIEALKKLKARRLSVATPYPEWLNEKLRSFLEGHGFSVVVIKGLGMEKASGDVAPERVYRLGKEVDSPDSDVVLISCTDFRTVEILDRLEQDLGKAVVSSNQATLWMLLRLAKLPDRLPGCGRLLETT